MGAAAALSSSQCELCRRWGTQRVCSDCEARYAPPRARCARCGLALGQALGHSLATCGECLRDPPPFDRAVVAVDYGFPWDALVIEFKFRGRVELAAALADLLVRRVAGAAGDAGGAARRVDLVAPVPLARPRLAERGFNQAWELARRVAARLGLPARASALSRALDTPHQAALTRAERQRNLRNAFVPATQGLAGRRVALVDDVMTTGATAREAAAALLRGGAASVELWLFARTP